MAAQYLQQDVSGDEADAAVVVTGAVGAASAGAGGAEAPPATRADDGGADAPLPDRPIFEQALAGGIAVGGGVAPAAGLLTAGGNETPPGAFVSSSANPIAAPGPLRPGLMPSPQALAEMKRDGDSMAALFSYCEVPQEVGTRFFKAAGIVDRDHLSMCCTTSREEVEEVFRDISVEAPVNLGTKAKIRLAYQVARVVNGIAEPPPPPVVQQAGGSAAGIPNEIIMKKELATDVFTLGDTVWQTSRAEVKLLTKELIKKGYARYIKEEGSKPTAEENVTPEQLSALELIVRELGSIYADFALWVPFWRRMAKKKRFMGRVFDDNGIPQTIEILGPPNVEA